MHIELKAGRYYTLVLERCRLYLQLLRGVEGDDRRLRQGKHGRTG